MAGREHIIHLYMSNIPQNTIIVCYLYNAINSRTILKVCSYFIASKTHYETVPDGK